VLDYDRQFYEVCFDYQSALAKLKKEEEDDLAQALHEVFSSFQYEAAAIIQAVSLILQTFLVVIKGRKIKKVCLVV